MVLKTKNQESPELLCSGLDLRTHQWLQRVRTIFLSNVTVLEDLEEALFAKQPEGRGGLHQQLLPWHRGP